MKSLSLDDLPAAIEQETLTHRREAVGAILDRLAHDLSSPISTLRLESQSLELVKGEANAALAAGRSAEVSTALTEVGEIGENLASAAARLERLAELARALGRELVGGQS